MTQRFITQHLKKSWVYSFTHLLFLRFCKVFGKALKIVLGLLLTF